VAAKGNGALEKSVALMSPSENDKLLLSQS
jgi:hypothetical protein